jgi:hypothetical protein
LKKYLEMLRQFDCSTVIEVKESQALRKSLAYLRNAGIRA